MKTIAFTGLLLLLIIQAYGQQANHRLNPDGLTLATRILAPKGFERTLENDSSFATYLRQLQLKPHGSFVKLYNGRVKPNNDIYDAVVDLSIGKRDLHQCADAVMRLRAEYLWHRKQYEQIHFNFTNGFRVDYTKWMNGNRIVVEGNKTYWTKDGSPSNRYKDFWKYLEIIFSYAGTLSLSQELKSVSIDDLKIGDVFIRGGSPGHAIIVVDLAENTEKKEKLFLLAQSYMPAQEIQILKNPGDKTISPWYSVDFGEKLSTPEWTFDVTELKRFEK